MTTLGRGFWNERFAGDGYVFGVEPAAFLREHAGRLAPKSKVLLPADGEGRNSVYLAKLGHEVVATDISEHAVSKANKLAEREDIAGCRPSST